LHLFRPFTLDMAWTHLMPSTFHRIFHHPNLRSLTHLRMEYLDDETAAVLASSPSLGHLHNLCLVFNCLGNVGLEALASSSLVGLRSLDITLGFYGPEPYGFPGLLALVESARLERLAELYAD